MTNERFYTEHLPHVLRASNLDDVLASLDPFTDVNESNVRDVLDAHAYLMRLFQKFAKTGKRSLASKYLHFHRPNLFFIYDSRARRSIGKLSPQRVAITTRKRADVQYANFVSLALGLRAQVAARFHVMMTPRQLDRLLLAVFDM